MMIRIIFFLLIASPSVWGQGTFPHSWFGTWSGELEIFPSGMKLPMHLEINPADSSHKFNFITTYHTGDKADRRNYILIEKDKQKGIYVVDEQNSILIAETYQNQILISDFEVQGTKLMILYRFEESQIVFEVFAGKADPYLVSGGTSEEIPQVKSYLRGNYQKAILRRKP